ncbi:MAG: hypothetical protein ACE5G8_05445, partial [Anaerolineae bacterium]
EDIDLSRQIVRYYDVAGTDKLVAVIRKGEEGSTTDYTDLLKRSRQSREKALALPGAFTRMQASANASTLPNYWCGRIVWYYLASVRWNLEHKHIFTAASRVAYILASFVLGGRHILSAGFWRGAARPHIARVNR